MKSSSLEKLVARIDMPLVLNVANAAVGKAPAPHITLHMLQQARLLASIARAGGSKIHILPIYGAALSQDCPSFVSLFYSLWAQADAVITSD